ncbi:FecCD family ABC transporter permease [Phaeobacter inhibens]|uniref:FecCD family ABC transporter permease n=1 Tax=Phaeobacter inhibens TaxID=221822 RepID=UPI0021A59B8D|nr:iron chelate uptake ABC transporter family permease subunit [Phaeobacter inhibens]UWR48138.1 iron chelate uptake ABC transporter family permease subunit [Phaeobacter inhibens]UWS07096.1 iron chelate uptake ABC transporter family permease subunit [Phaeobacter inhibens]
MIWTLRLSSLSVQISRRAVLTATLLLSVLLATAVLALTLGSYPLRLADMQEILTGGGTAIQQMILLNHRMPRILTALGAGAAFGLSGAMFQTMMRNPLASPDVIGFNAGASCGALVAMMLTGGMVLPGAIAGALITAAVVTLLAWSRGLPPYRLILTGVGASLVLTAIGDLLISRMDAQTAADMAQWLIGTLNARSWSDVTLVWGGLLLLAPPVIWLQFPLTRMGMADDLTTGLGMALSPLRLAVTGTGILLAALAVSTAGPLPFVAFAAGPIARRLIPNGRPVLLAAAASGALITLLADTAARAVPMIQLPAGVFTALIGAPVLIWLLLAQFRKGAL